ncbi:MAG TPA: hypothetical protein VNQ73_15340 [Ilumatobacter sp.]|nr:hypothetical protein [Ilumatobacter sp.]
MTAIVIGGWVGGAGVVVVVGWIVVVVVSRGWTGGSVGRVVPLPLQAPRMLTASTAAAARAMGCLDVGVLRQPPVVPAMKPSLARGKTSSRRGPAKPLLGATISRAKRSMNTVTFKVWAANSSNRKAIARILLKVDEHQFVFSALVS